MLIARQKKRENIAEYLLYMWQVEDLIRAYGLDVSAIQKNVIDQFDQPESVKKEIRDWYEELIENMIREGVRQTGHLQANKQILDSLTALHERLLKSADETAYSEAYYRVLPAIVELRAKAADKTVSELETCFSALYGLLLLRLQGKEVSLATQTAASQIGQLLAMLAQKQKEKECGQAN